MESKYKIGDRVGIWEYESDVPILDIMQIGDSFEYKVCLAGEIEWIIDEDIAYKVEIAENKPVYPEQIKSTRMSARDRGIIDEIIKALKFLEEDKMICYTDEIEFLKKIRTWQMNLLLKHILKPKNVKIEHYERI